MVTISERPDPLSPEQLFAAAAGGDPEAFDRLLETYLPQLHAFVRVRLGSEVRQRETSMDIVQSVCRQLVAHRNRLDFEGEARFRGWLFTTAANKIREKVRHHLLGCRDVRRQAPIDHGSLALLAPQLATPSQEAIGQETAAALTAALDALADDHREVITLARLVGLPHGVIGELMQRSEPAVRQLLGRALVQLGRELRARGIDLPEA